MAKLSIEKIKELEEQLLSAMKDRNIEQMSELLHDNLQFVIPTGQTITKEMDLANMASGHLNIHSLSASEQSISSMEDSATVSVVIHLKGEFMGQTIDGNFKYLRVWKKEDGSYKVVGGAGMQLPEM